MKTGHFAALLARARGQVATIRPHAAARYAWANPAADVAVESTATPDIGLPAPTPQPQARTQTQSASPAAMQAERPAPSTRIASAAEAALSPDHPELQVRQPAKPPAAPPVGAGSPAKTASALVREIAGKPAPTTPPVPPSAPAAASTPPTDVTARPQQRSTHPPAIVQTRNPRPAPADTPAEVHLHIGRIEVIAPAPPPPAAGHAEGRPPARRPLSLDDYLAGRRGA